MTDLAEKLLDLLKKQGPTFEYKATELLFNKPGWPTDKDPEKIREFWQWLTNMHGFDSSFKTGNEFVRYKMTVGKSFHTQTLDAFHELKALGLVRDINNGYNEYTFALAN